MANNDVIYEAYMGARGKEFQASAQKRIGWIVDKASDYNTVWDVGCSQGITSILLAQQGKQVVGIDVQPEAIEFAQNILSEKHSDLAKNLRFVCADFFEWQPEGKADCILMTEVLEHLEDPARFLEIAASCLNTGGRLIITVPFGVNDHPDHHSTFYMKNLYDLVSRYFDVVSWDFLERWEGLEAAAKGSVTGAFVMDGEAIDRLERHFEVIDRQDVTRIETLYNLQQEGALKYRKATENHAHLKKLYNEARTSQSELQKKADEYATALILCEADMAEQMRLLSEVRRSLQNLQSQVAYLRTENEQYRLKLAKITDTWYGRLAIKAWRLLKRIRAKLPFGRK